MKLSFLDFWDGFDVNNNFLLHLLSQIKEIKISKPEEADIIIFSLFGKENHKYKDKKRIFYTGENVRPNFDDCDYSISFDFDAYDNKNIRIPLWYFYIDWFNVKSYGNPNYLIPENYLYHPNEFTKKSKNSFCSIVFSAPHKERLDMARIINNYKKVSYFGKFMGKQIPEGEKSKMDVISNYKFNICFENSIFPGYFTEKLLHAKIAGCIPIYKSDLTMQLDFNPNCCLNLESGSYEEILERVIELDRDPILYKKMIDEPLFRQRIILDGIINKTEKMIR